MNDNAISALTSDDIRAYDWPQVIKSAPRKECTSYHGPLFEEAERLKREGDERGSKVFDLLGCVASLHPDRTQAGNPYEPAWKRPVTLQESDFKALEGILSEIADPEFRARVADVLWEFRRNHKAAEVAVLAYLESARQLEDQDHWPRS